MKKKTQKPLCGHAWIIAMFLEVFLGFEKEVKNFNFKTISEADFECLVCGSSDVFMASAQNENERTEKHNLNASCEFFHINHERFVFVCIQARIASVNDVGDLEGQG